MADPSFADYGPLFLQYAMIGRTTEEGGFVQGVRHAPGSVTFERPPGVGFAQDDDTVADFMAMWKILSSEMFDTNQEGILFKMFALQLGCTLSRLIDGTIDMENIMTMQCYDNFFADVYLENPEGLFTIYDLFTWYGLIRAYMFMSVNNALIGAAKYTYMMILLWGVWTIGGVSEWGYFKIPVPFLEFIDESGAEYLKFAL